MTPLQSAQRKIRKLEQRLAATRADLKECREKAAAPKGPVKSARYCETCRMNWPDCVIISCQTPECPISPSS